ncbi:hypothetical protein QE177_15225 (plasmid) [Arsenophonus sp. aPb]|uniref:hypothetical protein n=1 Tax=Arsenophonus sp. aPb TaxID=3041619 RepID=UPI0024695475|nr:hypothetical protein [Arsenophonus sp. aPb]WGL99850.1 hypothetical protein QE177_15225 [Arsenophonus sp. aPb]
MMAYGNSALASITALNGIKVSLTGDFYNPNTKDIVQKSTPVIIFDGLSYKGGREIVKGYKNFFHKDVMGKYVDKNLKEFNLKFDKSSASLILNGIPAVQSKYPELIDFYKGIADEINHSLEDVYLAAWAEEGNFALDIKKKHLKE